jgi:hypothetical protein
MNFAAQLEQQMKRFTVMLVAALTMSTGGVSMAHPEHDDTPPQQSLKLDLAKKKDGAIVYVTNRGDKFSTAGATGVLTLMTGKKPVEVALKPVGANGMETTKATKIVLARKHALA